MALPLNSNQSLLESSMRSSFGDDEEFPILDIMPGVRRAQSVQNALEVLPSNQYVETFKSTVRAIDELLVKANVVASPNENGHYKPVLVALYGDSDVGKEAVMRALEGVMKARGVSVATYSKTPYVETFETLREHPSTAKQLHLIRCGYGRMDGEKYAESPLRLHDPNVLARVFARREINLNILVNEGSQVPGGNYDITFQGALKTEPAPQARYALGKLG